MGFRMEERGPNVCVVAYCDHCGGEITDCTQANVAYDMEQAGPVDLVHKRCTYSYGQVNPHRGIDEMRDWLVSLQKNIGFTPEVREKAKAEIRRMHGIILP